MGRRRGCRAGRRAPAGEDADEGGRHEREPEPGGRAVEHAGQRYRRQGEHRADHEGRRDCAPAARARPVGEREAHVGAADRPQDARHPGREVGGHLQAGRVGAAPAEQARPDHGEQQQPDGSAQEPGGRHREHPGADHRARDPAGGEPGEADPVEPLALGQREDEDHRQDDDEWRGRHRLRRHHEQGGHHQQRVAEADRPLRYRAARRDDEARAELRSRTGRGRRTGVVRSGAPAANAGGPAR